MTHWTSETVYWSEAERPPQGSPPPSNMTGGINLSLCCEEEEEDLQGIGMEPGKAWLRQPVDRVIQLANVESANAESANAKSANAESANAKSANAKSANAESTNVENQQMTKFIQCRIFNVKNSLNVKK